jgi:hypothetical protein
VGSGSGEEKAAQMKVRFDTQPSEWTQAVTDQEKQEAKALTLAMRQVTKNAVAAGQGVIRAAGFSNKFASSLVGIMPRDFVLDPKGYIHTTINYADVFETGKTIAGHPWIWLPLPSVPPISGRPHMTPKQYIQNVGPLVLMRRPGKPPMLGARIRAALKPQPFGRFVSRPTLRRGVSSGRGTFQTIPLFVGVSAVNIPQKFNVESAVQAEFDKFQQVYDQLSEPD